MAIQLRDKSHCKYDQISLGEVMLRLDPGEGRVRTARHFTAWEGGGEYNTSRGLRKCFGCKTAVCTAFVDNEVGRLIEDFIMQGGVCTDFIPPQIDPYSPVNEFLAPESYVLDDALYHSVDSMTIPQHFAHSSYLRIPTERNFIYGDMMVFLPTFEQRVVTWDLVVSNSLGETVRRITRKGQPPAVITWDGKTDAGEPIAPGEVYSFTFNAYDAQDNQTRIPGTPQRVNGTVQQVGEEWVVSIAADQLFSEGGAQLLEQASPRLDEAANVIKEKFQKNVVAYVYTEQERLSAERCRVIETELSRRVVLPEGALNVVPRFVPGLQPKLSKIEIHIL